MNTSRNSECSMPDDRPARAGADIGRGARDGAGDADAAEQRRADIGESPAPPVRNWSGDAGRSCRRRPPPRAATRWRRAARRRSRRAARPATLASENAGSAGSGNDRGECRRSGCRWFRPAAPGARSRPRATTTAIRMPGQVGRQLPQHDDDGDRQRRRARPPTTLAVGKRVRRAPSFGISSPGSLPSA